MIWHIVQIYGTLFKLYIAHCSNIWHSVQNIWHSVQNILHMNSSCLGKFVCIEKLITPAVGWYIYYFTYFMDTYDAFEKMVNKTLSSIVIARFIYAKLFLLSQFPKLYHQLTLV